MRMCHDVRHLAITVLGGKTHTKQQRLCSMEKEFNHTMKKELSNVTKAAGKLVQISAFANHSSQSGLNLHKIPQ